MLRAFQWDLARQVERLDWLLAQLPRYAAWGYDELYLHLEDAVEYPSLPGVARADAYSWRDLERLTTAATRAGLKVVPIANLLGHTQYLINHPAWRDLNELRAPDGSPLARGQICPLHPRTLEVAEKVLRDLAPFCTAGKIHVGLDESFHLARCPRCRAEAAAMGLAGHFANHASRLHALAAGLGLRMAMWADMLALVPAAIPLLPPGIIACDWYYHAFARQPRFELYNFAPYDLAPALRAQGIEYWGCPMNGAFRHEPLPVFGERIANLRSWWRRCRLTGAGGFLVTSWEPSRLALEMTTVVDAAAACLWLNPEADDATTMLAHGFARVCGLGAADAQVAARAALRCDEHACTGYARWELNERWDVGGTPDSGAAHRSADARFFTRLAHSPLPLPPPFALSVGFLRYLATRDAFVLTQARAVLKLRRLIGQSSDRTDGSLVTDYVTNMQEAAATFAQEIPLGRAAARAMSRRTRDARAVSPNETLVAQDAVRLRAWRRWLAGVSREPARALEASPLCGRWQLGFTVRNFAPTLQLVVVEQQQRDGTWRELRRRWTIEFRTAAARPRAEVRRPYAVPVDDPDAPLRVAVRGLGQVGIENLTLTDGLEVRRPTKLARRLILGQRAPARGWPEFNLEQNTGERVLRFASPSASPE